MWTSFSSMRRPRVINLSKLHTFRLTSPIFATGKPSFRYLPMNLSSPRFMICRYSSLVPSKYCFVPGAGLAKSSCNVLVIFIPTNRRFVPSSIVILLNGGKYHTRLETTTARDNLIFGIPSVGSSRRPASIKLDLHPLHCRQPVGNRAVDDRQKGFDLFRCIHDLNNDRQVGRELQDFRRAHPTARTKSLDAAQHCGPRQAMFPRRAHDPLIEQHTGMPIALAYKNT